jgi:uncharacterized protein (DUF362 family)/Pyruvate/2-oxoacid:ferredoxin oxidoreductase delta subunit
MESFVKRGDKVLLKPNLLSAKTPGQAVTTHPLVVKSVGKLVKDCGGILTIGDSPALGNWKQIASKTGMEEAAKYLGADLVSFKESVWVERKERHLFKKLEIAKEAVESDVVINLPKLKTHVQMYLTLGVKNIFGCLVGKRKPAWHMEAGKDNMGFAKRVVELYDAVGPKLTLMDGIVGMEGEGPGNGDPRSIGLIAAGRDAVAVDRVILEIVGGKVKQFFTLVAAEEMGIGEPRLDKIKILGEDIETVKLKNFKFPTMQGMEFGPPFLRPYIKDFVTTRPYEDPSKCTLCGNCIEACPPKIISKNKKLHFEYEKCIRCYCCMEVCPEGAMKMKQGLILKVLQGIGWM